MVEAMQRGSEENDVERSENRTPNTENRKPVT
jgi:hypothetical protein